MKNVDSFKYTQCDWLKKHQFFRTEEMWNVGLASLYTETAKYCCRRSPMQCASFFYASRSTQWHRSLIMTTIGKFRRCTRTSGWFHSVSSNDDCCAVEFVGFIKKPSRRSYQLRQLQDGKKLDPLHSTPCRTVDTVFGCAAQKVHVAQQTWSFAMECQGR